MRHLFHIVILALCISASASAQKARKIEARTLCYERIKSAATVYTLGAKGNKEVEVLLPRNNYSPTYHCRVQGNTVNFFTIANDQEKGEAVRTVIAKASVPANAKRAIFYFIPTPKGKLPYEVKTILDDTQSFPEGHTQIINLNPTASRFIIGEHKCQLKPGQTRILPTVTKKTKFNMAALKYAQLDNKNKWRTVQDRTAKFTDKKRTLIVSCYNATSKRPDLRVYKDFPSLEKSQQPSSPAE